MYDLTIKNGYVVSPSSTIKAHIGIKNGEIKSIGLGEEFDNSKRVIDAEGKYILPGVIDAHMHVEAPFQGCFGANDFYTQSISAAFGGVTMMMDFTNTFKGNSVLEAVKERHKEMSKSAIDYSIHGKFVEAPQNIIDEIEKIVEYGCPSFKMFMTYKKEGVMSEDETLIKVFNKSKELSALPMVHAENNAIAELNIEKFREEGNLSWSKFAEAKPILCEAEAVSRSIYFSKYVGNALCIVHTTNGEALEVAKKAQNNGYPIYIETCPHYLTIFKDIYENLESGHLAICSPPLRTKEEAENLWKGIQEGVISITGSDDCTYSREEKSMFLEKDDRGNIIHDFTKVVNGLSGTEIRLPILLSEGVSKGRISINKLCEITSTNIARLYGCYPQKGILAPGSDADIVIVDMDKEVTLSHNILHNNIDYCLHEGMKVKGYPVMTIARGKVIVENGEFHGNKGEGRFIKRKIDKRILEKFSL
ncbi:dihydropyrimidinase [Clostridium sp. MSJ-11]|uniref:Dihydropyrimidinase n=1 Tax=Clostridium mobile TaxID=2841512 RepID=A0ABS6EJ76_9CLOT|nr:dihydropyrimidinase [Clostridium mobile]MBU5485294.1 dihydropyrimidinase [Clostridium mobile]